MVRDEVLVMVAGPPRTMATAGVAAQVEIASAEEAAAAPVMPEVVATAEVADLLAAVGDATGGATSGRSAPHDEERLDPRVC